MESLAGRSSRWDDAWMIHAEGITVCAGDFRLADLSLRVAVGEYAVLMGPSGAGKTTLLEALAGLRPVTAGRLLLGSVDATTLPPAERGVGYVPQDAALFTTMRVRDNLGYGLQVRGAQRSAIEHRVGEVARLLGVERLLDRKPATLSGGEARRVALGRAIGFRPQVLLLDEPLSGLDDATREEVADALEAVRAATGASVLHVTHDVRDAERLADRCYRLEAGRLNGSPINPTAADDRAAWSLPATAPTARSSAS